MRRRTKRSGRKTRRTIKRKTRRGTKRKSRRTIKRRFQPGGGEHAEDYLIAKLVTAGLSKKLLNPLDTDELVKLSNDPGLIETIVARSEGYRPPDDDLMNGKARPTSDSPFRVKSMGTGRGDRGEQDKKDTQAPTVSEQVKAYWTKQIELQKKHIEELVVNVNLEQIEAERNNLHDQLRALQQNIYLNTKELKEGQEKIDEANAKLQNYWWNLFNVK